jgi:predicted porin
MKTTATLLACLLPIAAYAQDSTAVQIYGVVDAGVVAERGCRDGCPGAKLSPGVESGSRLGIKGREQLGGDTAAVFTLEAGIENDTGRSEEGRLFGRQAFVGLDGQWGMLTLGRQYNLQYEALADVADPFRAGLAGAATNLMGYPGKRNDNSVKYQSPSMRGVRAAAIYSFGESPFSTSRNRAYGASIGFAGDVFSIRIAHQRKKNPIEAEGTTEPVDLSSRNSLIAANLNLGPATLYAAFGMNRGVGSSPWDLSNPYGALVLPSFSPRTNDLLAGISVARGNATYMVSFIHKDDRTFANMDADQVALGMTYAMSKRSALYAAVAHIKNRNGAPYTVGNASERGRGNKAINVGFRHAF